MANDTGTADTLTRKGNFEHPDFPERSIERLKADAAGFDIDAHLVALLFREPFYADIVRSLHKEATEGIPTAGVLFREGIMRLWWNPLFLAAYSEAGVRGILKHEALHLALEHTTTRRYQPHLAWNWATDLAINCTLSADEMPPCGLLPGRALKMPKDMASLPQERQDLLKRVSALVQSLPRDLSSEEYFARLMQDPDFKEYTQASGAGDGDGGLGEMDSHEGWDELSDEDREFVAGKMRQIVKSATERADAKNSWGSVPASMREEIRKKVTGEIDWRAVFRQFVGCTQRADRMTSVFRLNKKYPGIHPGTTRDYVPTINIYLDQSGSMADDDIALLFGELAHLSHRVNFMLYYFDTEVDEKNALAWKRGTVPKTLRTRCGGTDYDAPTTHAHKTKCEGYIILTDGGASKPAASRIRRAWVLVPGQKLAWGEPDARETAIYMKKPLPGN